MNHDLIFKFSVNKENNSIVFIREFDANRSLVWKAWTTAKILDQWWAPKPWISKTKSMNFVEGGSRLYAMCGPEGEEHWALTEFQKIDAENSFTGKDSFSDGNGTVNTDLPESSFEVIFTEKNQKTLVENRSTYQSLEQLETTIQMGFKEGMTMALENLDACLSKMK